MIGVLALQGGFAAHATAIRACGVETIEVRTPDQLERVDALVMPGGESTTMWKLLGFQELERPLRARLDAGMPVFGTCAGMILLSASISDGRPDQSSFAALDIDVRRNGYGRQVDSFESDLVVEGLDASYRAVFIRAPVIERLGDAVEVLASVDDHPVLVRQGVRLAASFHPELTDDVRLHQWWLDEIDGVIS